MIGPYRLEREIARGGMGIVYLAHDTRLHRTVALKSLPAEVASEPERRDRFERESRLLASLNHPNIAAIYDIVESEGRPFLALEHIEGETLAQRIARGPLSLAETLDIAFQIATGMEAAHEQGVIHRDLKPGNVMITPGDQVKIVDFGLAKGRLDQAHGDTHSPTMHPASSLSSPTIASPTIASPAEHPGTIPGVILGTAPYLSPEQARGKAVDRRTDIWAFGCIVYECLTAKRAFQGETVSDTIAKILERDPDWSALPASTSERLRDLLRRTLEKDPRRRLRDMGEARVLLEEMRSGRAAPVAHAQAPQGRRGLSRNMLLLAFGIGIVLGGALVLNLTGTLGGKRSAHLSGPAWASMSIPPQVRAVDYGITDDGKYCVVLGAPRQAPGGEAPPQRLYVRRIDSPEFTPIEGSEGALGFILNYDGHYSFVAPASARSKNLKVFYGPIDGSAPPVPLMSVDASNTSAIWLESGSIFGSLSGKEWAIYSMKGDAAGRASTEPKPFDPKDSTSTYLPMGTLPGDRGVLLRDLSYDKGAFRQDIAVLDLKSGKTKILLRDGGSPRYASTGHLLFSRGGALLAVPFDLGRLEIHGEPVTILGGLRANANWSHAVFEIARNGTLLCTRGGATIQRRHAVIMNDDGSLTEWSGERQPFERRITASPDGKRFAAVITNSEAIYEIWVSTRGNPTSERIIAIPGVDCDMPLWSPDGTRIAYTQTSDAPSDGLYEYRVDGRSPPRFLVHREASDQGIVPMSWQPDGSQILCCLFSGPRAEIAVLDVPPAGHLGTFRRLDLEGASVPKAMFSPDGTKLGYVQVLDSGKSELFVRDYRRDGTLGRPTQVSTGGAKNFAWTRNSRNLIYGNDQGQGLLAFAPAPDGTVRPPIVAFPDLQKYRFAGDLGSMLPDDRVLLVQRGEEEDDITRFDVVFNFFDLVKEKTQRK